MGETGYLRKWSVLTVTTLALILLSAGILVLLLFGNGYALLFDRRALVFGLSLDGGAAGIVLLIKVVISVVLLTLLFDYPRHFSWFVTLSLVFSGLLLADSFVTSSMMVTGYQVFSPVLGFYFLFSAGLFIINKLHTDNAAATN